MKEILPAEDPALLHNLHVEEFQNWHFQTTTKCNLQYQSSVLIQKC